MKLVTLPSGTIDLEFDGIATKIQFNCSCTDALPYCRAMCCRLRSLFGVEVSDQEAKEKTLLTIQLPTGPFNILQKNPNNDSCFYLNGDNCAIHEIGKPGNCINWHCSPNGIGEGITRFGNGFTLMQEQA